MRALILLLAVLAGCSSGGGAPDDGPVTRLSDDERVVLFATDARRSPDGTQWIVPLRGWVHELEDRSVRRAAIAGVLEATWGISAEDAEQRRRFDHRARLFLADNESAKHVVVDVAGRVFRVGPTTPDGHFRGEVVVDASDVEQVARDGTLEVRVVYPKGSARNTWVGVPLVEPSGWSVISDIDDTVKVSEVTDKGALLRRTFFLEFEAAPGMAALFRRWREQGARVHFVSSSPWHLYEPLVQFLDRARFPARTLNLKSVRLLDDTICDLLAKGTVTKPRQIEPILAAFPQRRFVLVGDTGEQDPEVYASLLRTHGGQVARAYLRNVTGARRDDARMRAVFDGIAPERWVLFDDPSGLTLPEK